MSILGLILLGSLLTVAYAALVNTRQTPLREQSDAGNTSAKRVLSLLVPRSSLTLTYLISQTLLNFFIAYLATRHYILPFVATYGEIGGIAIALLLALGVLILTNVAAEGVGSAYPEAIARTASPLLVVWMAVFSPLTTLMIGLSKLTASAFGGERYVNTVTEEEIMTMVNAGEIAEGEKDMIYSVLQLDERDARQLMVPRMDVVAINVNATVEQALDTFIGSGFSRIPVYEETIDNVVGLLYAKDLLVTWRNGGATTRQIREMLRNAFFVPETLSADDLLKRLQQENVHMAIVVDEYGGTSGLVTIENLIEEIIGDIRDEYDQNEEAEYIKVNDNEYVIDASMNIADINDMMSLHIDDSEYDTLGGYIYTEMGHVPHVGEMLENPSFTLTVRSIEGRRIRKVHFLLKVKPLESEEAESNKENGKEAKENGKETDKTTNGESDTPTNLLPPLTSTP